MTVLQGDVSWKIWDLHVNGESLLSYVVSLPGVFGDRMFTPASGIDRSDSLAWVPTHFGLLTTHLSGYPIQSTITGHNNTATIFSEDVLMGGLGGVLVISVVAGLLTTVLYCFMEACLLKHRYAEAALAASYFVFGLMAWLLGDGITAILHVSILVGLASGYVLLKIFEGRRAPLSAETYAT